MKNLLLLFLSIQVLHSQDSASLDFDPPGTLRINDSLYIDKAPVDNLMYLEFVHQVNRIWRYANTKPSERKEPHVTDLHLMDNSLHTAGIGEIREQIQDEVNAWVPEDLNSENYLRHPDFRYHPVLNVSKEMAELYCKWRTEMVNKLWEIKAEDHPEVTPPEINYRLPTAEEFELAKETFAARSQLRFFGTSSPLKMNTRQNEEVLNFFRLPEYTSAEDLYLIEDVAASETDFNTFRCICEYED